MEKPPKNSIVKEFKTEKRGLDGLLSRGIHFYSHERKSLCLKLAETPQSEGKGTQGIVSTSMVAA